MPMPLRYWVQTPAEPDPLKDGTAVALAGYYSDAGRNVVLTRTDGSVRFLYDAGRTDITILDGLTSGAAQECAGRLPAPDVVIQVNGPEPARPYESVLSWKVA